MDLVNPLVRGAKELEKNPDIPENALLAYPPTALNALAALSFTDCGMLLLM